MIRWQAGFDVGRIVSAARAIIRFTNNSVGRRCRDALPVLTTLFTKVVPGKSSR